MMSNLKNSPSWIKPSGYVPAPDKISARLPTDGLSPSTKGIYKSISGIDKKEIILPGGAIITLIYRYQQIDLVFSPNWTDTD